MNVTVDAAARMLARTPPTLRLWLHDLPDEWAMKNEGNDSFSAWDVVGHLVQGEQKDWIPRARIILEQGTSRPFDPFERRGHRVHFANWPLNRLLEEFAKQREQNLETLRSWNLDDAQLTKRGRHLELGEVTLRQLIATWIAHDLGHIAQIARVMAKQLGTDVGPWQEYLPVLHDRVNA